MVTPPFRGGRHGDLGGSDLGSAAPAVPGRCRVGKLHQRSGAPRRGACGRPERAVLATLGAPSSDRLGATLGAVLAEPGGTWLSAGTTNEADRPPAPTLWRSPDGTGWVAERLPGEFDGAERLVNEAEVPSVADVAVGPGGMVLVGSTAGAAARSGAVWHTGDRVGPGGDLHRQRTSRCRPWPPMAAASSPLVTNGVDGLRQPRLWRWREVPLSGGISGTEAPALSCWRSLSGKEQAAPRDPATAAPSWGSAIGSTLQELFPAIGEAGERAEPCLGSATRHRSID